MEEGETCSWVSSCLIRLDPWLLSSCGSFVFLEDWFKSGYARKVGSLRPCFMLHVLFAMDVTLIRLLDYAICIILIEDAIG